jgi:hypothetical protein
VRLTIDINSRKRLFVSFRCRNACSRQTPPNR